MSWFRRHFRHLGWTEHGITGRRALHLIGIDSDGQWWLPSKTKPEWWDRRYNPRNPVHQFHHFESWLAGCHAWLDD